MGCKNKCTFRMGVKQPAHVLRSVKGGAGTDVFRHAPQNAMEWTDWIPLLPILNSRIVVSCGPVRFLSTEIARRT